MRRSLNGNKLKQQQGFSLLVVLAMLLVISFLAIGGAQIVNTEMAMSGTSMEKKSAFSYADTTLKVIENTELFKLDELIKDKTDAELATIFTSTCTSSLTGWKGLCSSSSGQPAWQRDDIMTPCGNSNSYAVNSTGGGCNDPGDVVWANPRYIIELLSPAGADERIYRVTVRAWGKNKKVSSTIQSYFSISS
ncbi:pilus assembly PilX family protein [Neisseria sp. Ec49-e6-T10]|uniref:pilus assembly PilX family protein n=1 Tax=Neisseria sp. Ec49-e6-T10 TaxID=3140744 RepID=UPI003EBD64A5